MLNDFDCTVPSTLTADTQIYAVELTGWLALCSLSFSWIHFRGCYSCSAEEDKSSQRGCTGKRMDFYCSIKDWRTVHSSDYRGKTRFDN